MIDVEACYNLKFDEKSRLLKKLDLNICIKKVKIPFNSLYLLEVVQTEVHRPHHVFLLGTQKSNLGIHLQQCADQCGHFELGNLPT